MRVYIVHRYLIVNVNYIFHTLSLYIVSSLTSGVCV